MYLHSVLYITEEAIIENQIKMESFNVTCWPTELEHWLQMVINCVNTVHPYYGSQLISHNIGYTIPKVARFNLQGLY